MPTLVIDNVPEALYDRIVHLAQARKRTPSDTVVEVLETALGIDATVLESAPCRNELFLTEEITAPFTIPRPEGTLVHGVRVDPPLPTAHDIPDEE